MHAVRLFFLTLLFVVGIAILVLFMQWVWWYITSELPLPYNDPEPPPSS